MVPPLVVRKAFLRSGALATAFAYGPERQAAAGFATEAGFFAGAFFGAAGFLAGAFFAGTFFAGFTGFFFAFAAFAFAMGFLSCAADFVGLAVKPCG